MNAPELPDPLDVELDLVDVAQAKINQAAACTRLLAAAVSSGNMESIHDVDAGYIAMLVGDLTREAVESIDRLHELYRAAVRKAPAAA